MRWMFVPLLATVACDEPPEARDPIVDVPIPDFDTEPDTKGSPPTDTTTTPAMSGPPFRIEDRDDPLEVCISRLDGLDRVVDEAAYPELDYPTDLHVLVDDGCYIGADVVCRAHLVGNRVEVEVRGWVQTEPEITCLVPVPYIATCPLPPLPAGTYTLDAQGPTTTFTVPHEGGAICAGTLSAGGNPGW